jgi:flagellar basal body rod protein FlgG
MYRTALALTSATLMLTATTAAAQETEPPPGPPPINACGTTLKVQVLKEDFQRRETKTGFALSGNLVLRISDEDSSVVVRQSGRFSVKLTETGATVTNTGRTLLDNPGLAEAIEEAGLPELPLIIGRVVIEDNLEGTAPEIVSVKGRVIDVCELLAR